MGLRRRPGEVFEVVDLDSLPSRPDPGDASAGPGPDAATDGPSDGPSGATVVGARRRPTRRDALVGLAGVAGGLWVSVLAPRREREAPADRWPGPLDLGRVGDVLARTDTGPWFWPDYAPTIIVVAFDPSVPGARSAYPWREHAHISPTVGLMALNVHDPHLGCRTSWCESSQWFETPCHGERYNRWGEYRGGPAPRGLDRYVSWVDDDGHYRVDATRFLLGPRRNRGVLDQDAEGPHCVG